LIFQDTHIGTGDDEAGVHNVNKGWATWGRGRDGAIWANGEE